MRYCDKQTIVPKIFPEQVRGRVDEFLKLIVAYDGMVRDDFDMEEVEKGLNMFLKWLGAKKYVGDGLGWDAITKRWVGKRALSGEALKKALSEFKKHPEKLWR